MHALGLVSTVVLAATHAVLAQSLPEPISGESLYIGDWAEAFQKAQSFVDQLTIPEKVNLTTGQGIISRCLGNTGGVSRMGFPGLCLQDSPTGIRLADLVSVFPSGMNSAATFDRDLIRARGQSLGAEARGKGVNVLLAPGMNIARAPAAGRNWEAAGADPYLAAEVSAESIIGIQSQGVIACAKHWLANEQEHFRNYANSQLDDRTSHEVYQLPFARSVQVGVASVMCSYNRVNGLWACHNPELLDTLKSELGFQGFVTSDWVAIYETGAPSVLAGTDMNMPGIISYSDDVADDTVQNPAENPNSLWGPHLIEMVNNGTVPEERLDDMVTRIMASYYKLGQDQDYPELNIDYNSPDAPGNGHVDVRGDHANVIRQIGGASTVLLKNEGNILPLKAESCGQIGVFGSDAGPDPNGLNACADHGCDNGTLAVGWGSGTANFTYLVDPLQGLQDFGKQQGLNIQSNLNDYDYAGIQQLAANSQTCLAFVNSDSGEQFITVAGNQGDRNNLTLWHDGDTLIQTVAGSCENTIVVMHTVGQVIMEPWIDLPNVKAVVWAGLPGQESGNAITDVLFGMVNPSGRLPFTMARQRSDYGADVIGYDLPEDTTQLDVPYSDGLMVDYRHFDQNNIEPRYEFGFGLSYSTFGYSDLQVQKVEQDVQIYGSGIGGPSRLWEQAATATFTVTNSQGAGGHEVSQLYLSYPEGTGEPPKVLRGFERTYVQAGESAQVTMQLNYKDLAIWDVNSQTWVQPSGQYTVQVGSSSRKLPLKQTFTL